MMTKKRKRVVMAGATGFVGTRLREALREDYDLICLTRSAASLAMQRGRPGEEWRQCDLFSVLELEEALSGADYAIYLVHSMMPSARLIQGSFADLDLILADNFSRAAETCGLEQILYIGGLIPTIEELSPHLTSRWEVERVLGSRRTPVTALRAGLVVGPGGSSLRIVINLVRRLPIMVLPAWTQTQTQPIAIEDIIKAVRLTLGQQTYACQHLDIGGPDVMSYSDMLQRTAQVMGLKRRFIHLNLFSMGLSKMWVALLGGASRYLVGPLVDSLKHPMIARDNPVYSAIRKDAISFDSALLNSLDSEGQLVPNPRDSVRPKDQRSLKRARRVRSVQRMPLPENLHAEDIGPLYFSWLPRAMRPFLRSSQIDGGIYRTSFILRRWVLIEFTHSPQRSTPDRQLFYVTGGFLARTEKNRKGRIEFREMSEPRCLLVAVHDFTPTLPWFIYRRTQALYHLWVMNRFAKWLSRKPKH
jgi:uncharacterized protein YbjT (DUF2867 family)